MKAIVCELCGGNELVKEDGFFRCTHCGTKYSLAEAKALFVEISGTVKVEGVADTENLLARADSFEDEFQFSKAMEYYNRVLDVDAKNAIAKERLRVLENGNVMISLANSNSFGALESLYLNGVKLNVSSDCCNNMLPLKRGHYAIEIRDSLSRYIAGNEFDIDDSSPYVWVKPVVGVFKKEVQLLAMTEQYAGHCGFLRLISDAKLLEPV